MGGLVDEGRMVKITDEHRKAAATRRCVAPKCKCRHKRACVQDRGCGSWLFLRKDADGGLGTSRDMVL